MSLTSRNSESKIPNVKVTSEFGDVSRQSLPPRGHPYCLHPDGTMANKVTNPETYQPVCPIFKGVQVTVEPAPDEKVSELY